MENSMAVPPKIKNRNTLWCTIPFLGIYPKELKAVPQKGICAPVFIIALSTLTKKKQPKCSLIDEWINKMWYIYTTKYFFTKEKHLGTHYHTDEPRGHTLGKTSQSQKDNTVWFRLLWGTESCQTHRNKEIGGDCQGLGDKGMRNSVGIEFQFSRWESSGDAINITKHFWNVHVTVVKMVKLMLCIFYHKFFRK